MAAASKKSSKAALNDNDAKEIEDFYGVYLLYCINPKYKGRTYIGYTVDPNRRINQHNKGSKFGGAWRTSNRGPWEMVLIVHGFPNDISALRFEWSWQHPTRSRRLKHVPPKKSREKSFDFCIRMLGSMLNLEPWNRLPLTVRWLKPEYEIDFPAMLSPPLHMPLVRGPVKSVKSTKSLKGLQSQHQDLQHQENEELFCNICFKTVALGEKMECLNSRCGAVSHVICLSEAFLATEQNVVIPVQGKCVTCECVLQWGDLVRKKKGCYNNLNNEDLDTSYDDDFH